MQGLINYTVTCGNCKESSKVGIVNGVSILWNNEGNVVSGRKRLDGNWGFQCISCGNDDLLTEQEKKDIKNLQQPDPKDIDQVIQNLVPQKPRFLLEKL